MWTSTCSSMVAWRDYSLLVEWSWYLWWKGVDHHVWVESAGRFFTQWATIMLHESGDIMFFITHSPLRIMLAVGFLLISFIILRWFPFARLLSVFIVKRCWDLLNAFSASVDMITCFVLFSFMLLMWWIYCFS